ncbi:hypothetical protein SAMN05661096_00631 [Marivirga sericea]|uniref:Uncharacterized protein n=1 Tax=Marivirga sericea TaxID=1028 RepID=A0A1X7IG92_9BACT|nr:DUF6660 family protein [Marivirga sericea]SMG13814.1 hypothetical protein SAMN05661096_00631 [Marivirga sericea]
MITISTNFQTLLLQYPCIELIRIFAEVKITCYILSFYFMALTGVACADTVPQRDTSENISVVNTADNNHDHDSNRGWDGCSPLCVCHCCHVHFLSAAGIDFTHLLKLPAVHTAYIQDFSSIEISGFLKPPMS